MHLKRCNKRTCTLNMCIRNHSLLVLTIYMLQLGFISSTYAQEEDTAGDRISLTIIIVPEIIACRPNGYANYNDNQLTKCDVLNYKSDVKLWIDEGKVNQAFYISPGMNTLSLNQNLDVALSSIVDTATSLDPNERFSVVFVFNFGQNITGLVSLERSGGSNDIKSWNDSYEIDNSRRWITHNSATTLFPTNYQKWILKLNSAIQYSFQTD